MSAFLLTANPATWTDEEDQVFLADQAKRFQGGRTPHPSTWSTRRKVYCVGDRIYMLLQGKGARGLIASGFVSDDEVRDGPHWSSDGRRANYVNVVWDAFMTPDDVLPTDQLTQVAPNTGWRPQSSGTRVDPADELALERAWVNHLDTKGLDLMSADALIGTNGTGIKRGYRESMKKSRLHQQAFRQLLLGTYPAECAHCGLDVIEVLDAAHLIADSVGGAATAENGRLLCANHHRAFDAGLLRWTKGHFVPVKGAAAVPPTPPP